MRCACYIEHVNPVLEKSTSCKKKTLKFVPRVSNKQKQTKLESELTRSVPVPSPYMWNLLLLTPREVRSRSQSLAAPELGK